MKGTARNVVSMGAVALAFLLVAVFPARADEERIPAGTWSFVPEESDDIEERLAEAASHMNILIRRIARNRLRNANKPVSRVVIGYQEENVHISLRADEPTIITPVNGDVVPYTREDGEVVRANTKFEPGLIRQFFDSDDGEKEIVYRLRSDGLMAMETTVFSEKLREPFRYTWVFRKQA